MYPIQAGKGGLGAGYFVKRPRSIKVYVQKLILIVSFYEFYPSCPISPTKNIKNTKHLAYSIPMHKISVERNGILDTQHFSVAPEKQRSSRDCDCNEAQQRVSLNPRQLMCSPRLSLLFVRTQP